MLAAGQASLIPSASSENSQPFTSATGPGNLATPASFITGHWCVP